MQSRGDFLTIPVPSLISRAVENKIRQTECDVTHTRAGTMNPQLRTRVDDQTHRGADNARCGTFPTFSGPKSAGGQLAINAANHRAGFFAASSPKNECIKTVIDPFKFGRCLTTIKTIDQ